MQRHVSRDICYRNVFNSKNWKHLKCPSKGVDWRAHSDNRMLVRKECWVARKPLKMMRQIDLNIYGLLSLCQALLSSPPPDEAVFSQIGKLMFKEVKWAVQGHLASRWWSRLWDSCLLSYLHLSIPESGGPLRHQPFLEERKLRAMQEETSPRPGSREWDSGIASQDVFICPNQLLPRPWTYNKCFRKCWTELNLAPTGTILLEASENEVPFWNLHFPSLDIHFSDFRTIPMPLSTACQFYS